VGSRQPGAPIQKLAVDGARVEAGRWPYTLPVVAQVVEHGLDLDAGINVFVGANGSGKSTLVEAVAACWARRVTVFREDWIQRAAGAPAEEDSDLYLALRPVYTRGGPTGGLFLRAERLHAQAAGFSDRGRWKERVGDQPLLTLSHGEGFLRVLQGMTAEPGLYILDEPESALSFDSSLALLTIMSDMRAAGSQILLATHSPILAAVPGARIYELDETGLRCVDYDDMHVVQAWRAFLDAPDRYLRHLFTSD
jgi:predicted ATPase